MSLDNYLDKAGEAGQEIEWGFSAEEIQRLYTLLSDCGYAEHLKFVVDNHKDIVKYLSLTPSRREQKRWADHPNNLQLRFAALQLSNSTVAFQDDIFDLRWMLDRGSYREFHATLAQAVMNQHLELPFAEFPFEDFDNPFLHNVK